MGSAVLLGKLVGPLLIGRSYGVELGIGQGEQVLRKFVGEQCGMVMTYPNGELAVLDSTLRARTPCEAFVYGTGGLIRVQSRWHETQSLTLERNDQQPEVITVPRSTHGYDYEAAHVMQCLAEARTESAIWSLDDSLNLMTLLDAVRAETGIVYE